MLRNVGLRLLFSGSGFGCGVGVFLGEALDTASGVHELLLASEERVAIGADFDAQHIALNGRASGECVSTSAVDGTELGELVVEFVAEPATPSFTDVESEEVPTVIVEEELPATVG